MRAARTTARNEASNKARNEAKRSNKFRNITCFVICVLILGMFLVLTSRQADRYNALRVEYNRIQEDLAREQAVFEDLQYQMAHFDSDAYIEALARERFGWLKPNEIVFRMIAD